MYEIYFIYYRREDGFIQKIENVINQYIIKNNKE